MKSLREFWKWVRRGRCKAEVASTKGAEVLRRESRPPLERQRVPTPGAKTTGVPPEAAPGAPAEPDRPSTGAPATTTLPRRPPPGIRRKREKLILQVGIDFGTSATKIAYARLGTAGKRVTPLVFKHRVPSCPSYCMPSVCAFDPQGKFLLGFEAARVLHDKPYDFGLRRLKVVVAGRHDPSFRDDTTECAFAQYASDHLGGSSSFVPEHVTTAFVAYAIHVVEEELARLFAGYDLDIGFNVCIPIDHVENVAVKKVFDRILLSAELLAKRWPTTAMGLQVLELAADQYDASECLCFNEESRVLPVPEAVAEIASYCTSVRAQDGLHAIIDFGAGTTDVSIFNRVSGPKQNRDSGRTEYVTRLWWYATKNLPRGTNRLERVVASFLERAAGRGRVPRETDIVELLDNIENAPEEMKSKLRMQLRELRDDADPTWGKAFTRRRGTSEWDGSNKVLVFVSGGGARSPFVSEIFSSPRRTLGWGPYPVTPIPVPNDYDSMGGTIPFDRMSVAYGLFIPEPELPQYALPRDCPDQTPMKEFKKIVDADGCDVLYPTPGWLGKHRGSR